MSNFVFLLNISIVVIAFYGILCVIHFFADVSAKFVIKHRLEGFKEHVVIGLYLLVSVTTIIYSAQLVISLLRYING